MYSGLCVYIAHTIVPYSEHWLIQNSRHLQKPIMMIMYDDHAYSELRYSQRSLFKHFQGYLGMFRGILMRIQPRSQPCNQRGDGRPTLLFSKSKKSPDFGNKVLDYVHLNFLIQNVVLRVSRRNASKMFPCGPSFSFFLCC